MDITEMVAQIKELAIGDGRVINTDALIAIADAFALGDEKAALQLIEVVEHAPTTTALLDPLFEKIAERVAENPAAEKDASNNTGKLDLIFERCEPLTKLATALENLVELAKTADNAESILQLMDEVKALTKAVQEMPRAADDKPADIDVSATIKVSQEEVEKLLSAIVNAHTDAKVADLLDQLQTRRENAEIKRLTRANEELTAKIARLEQEKADMITNLPNCMKCGKVDVAVAQAPPLQVNTNNNLPPPPQLPTPDRQAYNDLIQEWVAKLLSRRIFPIKVKDMRRRGFRDDFVIKFGKKFGEDAKRQFAKLVDDASLPIFEDGNGFVAHFHDGYMPEWILVC